VRGFNELEEESDLAPFLVAVMAGLALPKLERGIRYAVLLSSLIAC
jgi:hypothetical protein